MEKSGIRELQEELVVDQVVGLPLYWTLLKMIRIGLL